ncbi:MAG: alpha/beta hydrolase [Hyphomicrobiaceae bacterium]|nr:alpha/beta hydrolase [Hyphomicrobiaceae bacterium]
MEGGRTASDDYRPRPKMAARKKADQEEKQNAPEGETAASEETRSRGSLDKLENKDDVVVASPPPPPPPPPPPAAVERPSEQTGASSKSATEYAGPKAGSGPGGGGNTVGRVDTGSQSRGLGGGAGITRSGGGGESSGAEPAPETAPAPIERSTREESPPGARDGAPVPMAAAPAKEDDWSVVPVYYGTDRARVPNDKRIDYGSDRARRLELGRAMVSVPKAHEVPQIERPWAITVPYFNYKIYEQKEDPKKHFIMQELKTLSEAELLALVKERLAKSARYKDHAFVFVHGYNTSFDFAVYRAAQIAYDIKFDGAPFVYSWPSGGGIASYTYDRESSAQSEPFFKEFLKMVAQKSGAKHVSVIAHSMGNQLLLRVLQDLQRTKPEGVEISQIIFAAPDVDRDSFETIASELKGFATGGITLYAAANDRALSVSKRFYGGIPRAGDVPAAGPLIVPGVDTIDATAVSMDSLGLHHSGYAESNALLQDIGLLIQTGERPPAKRVPILQEVTTDKGAYWRYPPPQ